MQNEEVLKQRQANMGVEALSAIDKKSAWEEFYERIMQKSESEVSLINSVIENMFLEPKGTAWINEVTNESVHQTTPVTRMEISRHIRDYTEELIRISTLEYPERRTFGRGILKCIRNDLRNSLCLRSYTLSPLTQGFVDRMRFAPGE